MSGHCPCMTLSCYLTTGFLPSCPFHVSHDVLVLSLPCRSTPPFMSLTFSRYVRFICHVCPVLSLRVISLHLPSCRLVSLCFVSPCFHFCPLHVPFSSPLFPFHVPLLSCYVDFLLPPLISLHFPAFPLCSPIFPAKKHDFSSVFTITTSKNTEPQTSKEPAGGIEPGTPVLRHRLPEDSFSGTPSNCRAVLGGR